MSKHVTYRGTTIDMDSLRRENEKSVAVGNMKVNAKGDQLGRGGVVTKTADEIARDNHRVKSAIVNTGLKGPTPSAVGMADQKPQVKSTPKPAPVAKTKEVELPSGDIVIEKDDSES